MLSGIASTLFMLLLDQIDLFSVKAEKRRQRIEEIFDERIQDIKNATQTFNTAAIEALQTQKQQFAAFKKSINKGLGKNNIDEINSSLFNLASFMKVDLGYKNQSEFVEQFTDMEISL